MLRFYICFKEEIYMTKLKAREERKKEKFAILSEKKINGQFSSFRYYSLLYLNIEN